MEIVLIPEHTHKMFLTPSQKLVNSIEFRFELP